LSLSAAHDGFKKAARDYFLLGPQILITAMAKQKAPDTRLAKVLE
jgi:hypothetical protein